VSNQTYTVQASTNLTAWNAVGAATSPNNSFRFTNSLPGGQPVFSSCVPLTNHQPQRKSTPAWRRIGGTAPAEMGWTRKFAGFSGGLENYIFSFTTASYGVKIGWIFDMGRRCQMLVTGCWQAD
jgi:hypothetical protein